MMSRAEALKTLTGIGTLPQLWAEKHKRAVAEDQMEVLSSWEDPKTGDVIALVLLKEAPADKPGQRTISV